MRIHRAMAVSLFVLALPGCALAPRSTPPHLLGTWGTADSLREGDTAQTQMYIAADGLGLIVGSSPPPTRLDGMPIGPNPPRVIMGFPLRVAVSGDILVARIVLFDPREAHEVERNKIVCRYEFAGPVLSCRMPRDQPIRMTRRDMPLSEDAERLLAQIRADVR